eukprot:gene7734-7796_t
MIQNSVNSAEKPPVIVPGVSELTTERLKAARLFLVPMLCALALVAGWPLGRTIYFSMTNASLTDLYHSEFVGFDNYLSWITLKSGRKIYSGIIVDPVWWNAVWNTVRFSIVSVVLEATFGMIVALFLNAEFPGRSIVRAAILIPWAIPTIVSAQMWRWMLSDQFGIINDMAKSVGLIDHNIAWTATNETAMFATISVLSRENLIDFDKFAYGSAESTMLPLMLDYVKRALFYLGVVVIVVVSVFPFYYAILTAFKSGTSLFLIEYVPKSFDFSNFESVLTNGSFIRNLGNSVVVASLVVALSLFLGTFGAVNVIKGVDLEIKSGEFMVFVGPSGCGKSTLLRLIAGLEDITSGELIFDGQGVWSGSVVHTENLGADSFVYVNIGLEEPLTVRVIGTAFYAPGTHLNLSPDEGYVHRFNADGKPVAV